MKIAIIGYGKMGQEIEQLLLSRGHTIAIVIDENSLDGFQANEFHSADVAIEFTNPAVAASNYIKCFKAGVPVVSGTTGWQEQYDSVIAACNDNNGGFFYASNFSLGVNLFFEMNKHIAALMSDHSQYIPSMQEWHHTQKKDAPSGTAVTLANDLINFIPGITNWVCDNVEERSDKLQIKAHREGDVFGIHSIRYESEVDWIEYTHHAKNRKGFVMGAVLAAEFMKNRMGVFGMKDLLTIK